MSGNSIIEREERTGKEEDGRERMREDGREVEERVSERERGTLDEENEFGREREGGAEKQKITWGKRERKDREKERKRKQKGKGVMGRTRRGKSETTTVGEDRKLRILKKGRDERRQEKSANIEREM